MSKREERKRNLLQQVSLFEGLDESDINDIAPLLQRRKFVRGDVVVQVNTPGDRLYLVESGKLKVCLSNQNDDEIILSILKEGSFFGEMALLEEKPRSASVIALQATWLYELSRESFLRFVESRPRTLLNILRVVSERLRRADDIRRDLVLLDVYGRVAGLLLRLAREEGVKSEEGILLENPPSQQQIADMIGASRETINRVINEFIRSGTLHKEGRTLIIQPEALQDARC